MSELIQKMEKAMLVKPARWREGPCCFVLSTGRCGTQTIAALVELCEGAVGLHEPRPSFSWMLNSLYHTVEDHSHDFLTALYFARVQLIHSVVASGKLYFESNHFLTPLAFQLKFLYPDARFIHLIRHPGDFVVSGLRRKWKGPLVAKTSSGVGEWPFMNRTQQIAWAWNEINEGIERFKSILPDDTYITVKSEDMFSGAAVRDIYTFLELDFPREHAIELVMSSKLNAEKSSEVPPFQEWDRELQQQVFAYAPLATEYGYA